MERNSFSNKHKAKSEQKYSQTLKPINSDYSPGYYKSFKSNNNNPYPNSFKDVIGSREKNIIDLTEGKLTSENIGGVDKDKFFEFLPQTDPSMEFKRYSFDNLLMAVDSSQVLETIIYNRVEGLKHHISAFDLKEEDLGLEHIDREHARLRVIAAGATKRLGALILSKEDPSKLKFLIGNNLRYPPSNLSKKFNDETLNLDFEQEKNIKESINLDTAELGLTRRSSFQKTILKTVKEEQEDDEGKIKKEKNIDFKESEELSKKLKENIFTEINEKNEEGNLDDKQEESGSENQDENDDEDLDISDEFNSSSFKLDSTLDEKEEEALDFLNDQNTKINSMILPDLDLLEKRDSILDSQLLSEEDTKVNNILKLLAELRT